MSAVLLFKEGSKLKGVVFEVVTNENHEFGMTITDHPVERGSNVVDGGRPKPVDIKLEVTLTDDAVLNPSPVDIGRIFSRVAETPKAGRAVETYHLLRRLAKRTEICQLETSVALYKDVVISSISAPREVSFSNGLQTTIVFRQITVVQSQTVQIEAPKKPSGQKKFNAGAQNTKPAEPKIEEKKVSRSTLEALLKGVGI